MGNTWPPGFWWGTAASATQTEGSSAADDWHRWERAGRVPPTNGGNGFATRYADDFRALAALGFGHHRLSLDWARLEPEQGQHDQAAIEHYRRVLTAGREVGLRVWACLLHTALPRWLADFGGFLSPDIAKYWSAHVDFVANTFGDLVHGWMPVNGPTGFALKGYLWGSHPPGHSDQSEAVQVLHTVHEANFTAADTLRRATGREICSIQALAPIVAADDSPASLAAAERTDALVWDSWLRLTRDPKHASAFDTYGFSYYYAVAVAGDGSLRPYPADQPIGQLGYVPWADGIGIVLRRLARELPGRRFAVCELGYGGSDDAARCAYLQRALGQVKEALAEGIDIAGIYIWTGIDNYEWEHGDTIPFGLLDRDRRPRPSADLMRRVVSGATIAP